MRRVVDRAAVAVGDAVTLTVTAKGVGNVRNLRLPELPGARRLEALRAQGQRRRRAGGGDVGDPAIEWLLRPERPGTMTIPALTLATFDPVAKQLQGAAHGPDPSSS